LASFANYTASLNAHVNDNTLPQYGREYPDVKTIDFISECERHLYTALYDKGLHTIPQYEVDKYCIDLALIDGNKKLAIEVGEEVEYNSEQSYAIHLRNTRLIELGWKIIRFQPYQIRDDMEWCVNQVFSM
jgi:very-short-patch-repair endonuclease